MYICICNAIRECELRDYAKLGKTPNCGQCLKDADRIVEEELCELVAL